MHYINLHASHCLMYIYPQYHPSGFSAYLWLSQVSFSVPLMYCLIYSMDIIYRSIQLRHHIAAGSMFIT